MTFLTQGKTNWKYILIVVILAVIAGGGILDYYYSWIKELDTRFAEIELRLPEEKPSEGVKIVEFTPLKSPPSSLFIQSLNNAEDVKIDFHYEGD